jgi:hypothetical protein
VTKSSTYFGGEQLSKISIHKPFKFCNNKTNNLAKSYRKITPVINDHKIYYLSMYIIIVKIGTQTISTIFCNFQEDKFESFSN